MELVTAVVEVGFQQDVAMEWDRVPEVTAVVGWTELPENGWGALIAAAAGPSRVGRRPVTPAEFTTRVTVLTGRRVRAWTEPRTASDQAALDEDVDEYLADAGVPPRPAGYRWYLRAPTGWDRSRDLVDEVSGRMNRTDAVLPADVLDAARDAVEAVFANPVPPSHAVAAVPEGRDAQPSSGHHRA